MLSLIYLFFLHCICMVILEPFQFSDSKKGYWQKLKRNIRSLSQNQILDLVPSLLNVSDKTYIKVLFRKKDGRVPMFCVSPTVGGEFCGDLQQ